MRLATPLVVGGSPTANVLRNSTVTYQGASQRHFQYAPAQLPVPVGLSATASATASAFWSITANCQLDRSATASVLRSSTVNCECASQHHSQYAPAQLPVGLSATASVPCNATAGAQQRHPQVPAQLPVGLRSATASVP